MKIIETRPAKDSTVLPGADFADAWRVSGIAVGADAETIAARMGTPPGWVTKLMAIRNALVAPFGLKTRPSKEPKARSGYPFPVLSAQPQRVVMGLDDRHLDFRLVVEVSVAEGRKLAATATTYVRTHNRLGRLYLMAVTPFHRRIVPAMLKQAVTAAALGGCHLLLVVACLTAAKQTAEHRPHHVRSLRHGGEPGLHQAFW